MDVKRFQMIYTTKINKKTEDNIKYIILEPKIKEEMRINDIRIFGYDFMKNNQNKAKLIINNQKSKLKEFIKGEQIKDDKLKINMILSKDLSNFSHLFQNCTKLIKISNKDNIISLDNELADFEENDKYYIYDNEDNDDNYFYYSEHSDYSEIEENNFSSLSQILYPKLTNILQLNSNKISNMNEMFSNCISLGSLDDISEWNIDNVKDMNFMFFNCVSLSSLPDISKWNTENVTDMSGIFCNCTSLQ